MLKATKYTPTCTHMYTHIYANTLNERVPLLAIEESPEYIPGLRVCPSLFLQCVCVFVCLCVERMLLSLSPRKIKSNLSVLSDCRQSNRSTIR